MGWDGILTLNLSVPLMELNATLTALKHFRSSWASGPWNGGFRSFWKYHQCITQHSHCIVYQQCSFPGASWGNFHQPVRRQGVQTLFTMRGSKKAIKRREEWAKSQEDTLYRKGRGQKKKNLFHPFCPNEKEFNWMLFIEVKKNTPWSSQHFIIQLSLVPQVAKAILLNEYAYFCVSLQCSVNPC